MWDTLKDGVFNVINFFYIFLGGNNGGDWGMAIIIVTIVFRLLMTPLMYKQAKSSYLMQKVQPKIKEIQQKFSNDPSRQQQEMQKLYADAKFNPLAGCLPMLLQMPIFILLYQVLNEMGTRDGINNASFYNLIPDLFMSPSTAFSSGVSEFIPYLILMIVFAGATFIPMLMMQTTTDPAQIKQTRIMAAVMSVFMLFISWSAPAGVLLFWGVSSLIGVAQQRISLRIVKSKEQEEETTEVSTTPIEVVRKSKKPKPTKKS